MASVFLPLWDFYLRPQRLNKLSCSTKQSRIGCKKLTRTSIYEELITCILPTNIAEVCRASLGWVCKWRSWGLWCIPWLTLKDWRGWLSLYMKLYECRKGRPLPRAIRCCHISYIVAVNFESAFEDSHAMPVSNDTSKFVHLILAARGTIAYGKRHI